MLILLAVFVFVFMDLFLFIFFVYEIKNVCKTYNFLCCGDAL